MSVTGDEPEASGAPDEGVERAAEGSPGGSIPEALSAAPDAGAPGSGSAEGEPAAVGEPPSPGDPSGLPQSGPPFPPPFPSAAPGVGAPPPFPAPYPPAGGQPPYGQGFPGQGLPGQPAYGQPVYGQPGQAGFGQPGQAGFGQAGQPPYGAPYPQAQPGRRGRGGVIAAVVVGLLLLVAGIGTAGSIYALRSSDAPSARGTTGPVGPLSGGSEPVTGEEPSLGREPGGSEEEEEEPVQEGPEASSYPAEKIYDFNRVCDENVYYPEQPKRAGKAPHPVVLLVSDGDGVRSSNGTYYFDEGLSDSVKNTWAPESPAKVQMVACLDREKEGAKIRTCKYDDPKGLSISLMKASWRLRVYEAATGKKLLDKAMNGDDKACPYFVLYGPDKKIYAQVSDRAAVNALKGLVKK